jgi:4-diphosphocytidyl-2-C-methyl-D-erythritol kinase
MRLRAARMPAAGDRLPAGCARHRWLESHCRPRRAWRGGSSDCATTLLALNRLWGLGLSARQLAAIGLRLGADVPFFLFGRNAWVEGVGEHAHARSACTPTLLAVAKPPAGVSTAASVHRPSGCAAIPALLYSRAFLEAGFAFRAQRLAARGADALPGY